MPFIEPSRAERLALTQRHWLAGLIPILYVTPGYLAGLAAILQDSASWNLAGVLLLTHCVFLSGLINHELMHHTVFSSRRATELTAAVMSVINGACYVPFHLLRRQHMAHHVDKVGYDGFSISGWVKSRPRPLRAMLIGLESIYFPVLSLIARARLWAYPFIHEKYRHLRKRFVLVFCLRMLFFASLFWLRPLALPLYFVAYLGVITLFRIFDSFHHTFHVVPLGSPPPRLPRSYEQANTFSSLLSRRYPWVNALVLNYGYHNAHHALPAAPWYRLPAIDQAVFRTSEEHCIVARKLLSAYHRHRTRRIYEGLGRPVVRDGRLDLSGYYGIIMNVSFMDYDYNDL
jgi:fatty acid desaturase